MAEFGDGVFKEVTKVTCCHKTLEKQELNTQPLPSPGDLPNPGIERRSSTLQADSLPAEPPGEPKYTDQLLTHLDSLLLFSRSACLPLCDPMDCSTPGFSPSPSPGAYSNSCPLSRDAIHPDSYLILKSKDAIGSGIDQEGSRAGLT